MAKEFFTEAAAKEKVYPKAYQFGNRSFSEQELIDFANSLAEFNQQTDSFTRVNNIQGAIDVLGKDSVKEVSAAVTNEQQFELGGNIDSSDEEKLQLPYHSASNVCTSMDTVVPASMAIEQRKFNDRLRAAVADMGLTVESYVAKKLHYRSVEDLCFQDKLDEAGNKLTKFSAEQIDAIGTAIWNYESGDNGIIIADQTGTGKGRCAAGILRYAILELKVVPFFFTEKKHLINDIYRDLIAIGFDAGVPYKFRKVERIESPEFTDEQILKIIIQDIKDRDDIRIDFSFPEGFDINLLRKKMDEENPKYDEVEEIKQELIDAYRQHFMESGFERDVYELNTNYKQDVVEAMRKGKMLVEPFVPNLIDIKDVDGNIIYEAISKKDADAIYKLKGNKKTADRDLDVSDLILPAKYKLFCLPYSQVATGFEDIDGVSEPKNKTKLFLKYSMGSVVVLDEAHNASGVTKEGLSQTGQVIFRMVKGAKFTTYLSATYAKRADNMPLYALRTSIRECGLSDREMIEAFMKGGNALQEAVSAELARNGQLLRREKQIQGKSEYYYETEGTDTGDNQINKLNRVAGLYQKVLDFSGEVRQLIGEYKKMLPKDESDKIKKARSVNALSFQLFNFMLLGLKLRQTTEFAIKKLQSGRKVVITVASTMESALDNLTKTFLSNSGRDAYKVGDKIKNDFSLYIAYLLNYTMRYNTVDIKVNDDGEETETKQLVYVLDSKDELSTLIKDKMLMEYTRLLTEILQFETGIPIAPLDMIERSIKEAGFSISEITGRQRKITFGDNTSEGTISKRDIKKTDVVVREFNENDTDCLLINQSGATGISMHSLPNKKANIVYKPSVNESGQVTDNAPTSLSNKKEVKRRAMVITQMELDVNKEVQKLGRINRMGQVYQPEYTYVTSAIPSESRLTSLMEKKLRSLSANVSSNQQQASYLFTADDFFSDVAVVPFNETMQEVGMRGVTVTNGAQIQDFTKTLYFKDYKLQKDFYDTFAKKLTQEIITLKAQGLYTGQMSYKEYHAETLSQFPFYLGDNNSKTSFGRHSVIEKVSVKLYRERYTEKKIQQQIVENLWLKDSQRAEGGVPFNKLSDYQREANKTLDGYEVQKRELVDISGKQMEKELKELNQQIVVHTKELSKFENLEKGLAIEEELKAITSKKTEIVKAITDNAISGNIEAVQQFTGELNEIQAKEKALQESIKPYEEALKTKGEHKATLREIKDLKERMEAIEKRDARMRENFKEYKKLILNAKRYISQIESICELSIYEEDGIPLEENEKTKYKLKFSHPVVITGVSFPDNYSDLTPGQVEIKMSGVSEKYTYNLYRLEKEFSPEEIENGAMPLERLTIKEANYRDGWNEIAGKHDHSYRENRYMIVGSLLKTFSLGKSNEISGQIVKYNTIDNKNKIGIEVADNENQKQGYKSVYKVLEERYGEDSVMEKPIYYDGNLDNVKRFIENYVYRHYYGEAYSGMEKSTGAESEGQDGRISNRVARTIGFQISSDKQQAFVLIMPDEEDRRNADELRRVYNNEEWEASRKTKTVEDILEKYDLSFISLTEFTSRLRVEIISDSISSTDFLAYHFGKATKVEITANNYTMSGKSKSFPDVSKVHGRHIDRYRPGYGSQFSTFFPTNIIELDQIVNHGVPYTARLSMSYAEFIKLIQYLEKNRMKPTFATSSGYFENYKGEYMFEQFLDEDAAQSEEVVTGKVNYDESVDSEINELIDSLVKELSEV